MKTLALFALVALVLAAMPLSGLAGEETRTVTLKVEDQDIKDVIASIAQAGGLNVIVSPKVNGTITISLHDVPVRAALKDVVEGLGYVLIEEDYGILRVVPESEALQGHEEAVRKTADRRDAVEQVEKARAEARRLRAKIEAMQDHLKGLSAERKETEAQRAALEASIAALKKARAAADRAKAEGQKQVLQFHAVVDLLERYPGLLQRARTVLPEAHIQLEKGVLVVRAGLDGQKRLAAVLRDLRGKGHGDDGQRRMRLASARLDEAEQIVEEIRNAAGPAVAKTWSKRLLELRVFRDHLRKQIEKRGEAGQTAQQRAGLGRLDEGTRRLLDELAAVRAKGFDVVTVAGKTVVLPRVAKGVVVGPDGKPTPGVIVGRTDAAGRFHIETRTLPVPDEQGWVLVKEKDGAEAKWKWVAGKMEETTQVTLSKPLRVKVETTTQKTKTVHGGSAQEALRRAHALEQAARSLRGASLAQEAERLERMAKDLREQMQAQTSRRERAAQPDTVLHAVNALRRDVGQLRGEIRQLTALVRALVARRGVGVGLGGGAGGAGGGTRAR